MSNNIDNYLKLWLKIAKLGVSGTDLAFGELSMTIRGFHDFTACLAEPLPLVALYLKEGLYHSVLIIGFNRLLRERFIILITARAKLGSSG